MAGVRFEDVDLLGAISRIVDLHTQHYKEDFDLDKELISKLAVSDRSEDKQLLWMSRPCGTYTLREREVYLDGKPLSAIREKDLSKFRRDHLGFVFQDFNLLDTFNLKDNILLPLVLQGVDYRKMNVRMMPIVKELGIAGLLEKYPYEVSGGQKQRAAVARALITDPRLILADEPTGALDSKSTDELLGVFERINQSGQTILMVTHHMEEVILADRIIVMDQGKIVMDGKPKEIFSRVDEMKTLGLEVPYATELAWELKKEGVNLSDTITTKEELVEELCQFV